MFHFLDLGIPWPPTCGVDFSNPEIANCVRWTCGPFGFWTISMLNRWVTFPNKRKHQFGVKSWLLSVTIRVKSLGPNWFEPNELQNFVAMAQSRSFRFPIWRCYHRPSTGLIRCWFDHCAWHPQAVSLRPTQRPRFLQLAISMHPQRTSAQVLKDLQFLWKTPEGQRMATPGRGSVERWILYFSIGKCRETTTCRYEPSH